MNRMIIIISIAGILAVFAVKLSYAPDNNNTPLNSSPENTAIGEEKKSSNNPFITGEGKTYPYKKRPSVRSTRATDNNIDDLQNALYSEDDEAIKKAVESLADCSDCIDQLKDILHDTSFEEDFRKHAAQALLKSGLRDGILAVIDFIIISDLMEQYVTSLTEEEFMRMFAEGDPFETDQNDEGNQNLREEFKKMLAEVDSLENVPVLVDVLTGKEKDFSSVVEVPGDVREAIVNAIRKVSDQDEVGELLAGQYSPDLSPEIKNMLISIGHPKMDTILAAKAYKEGNDEEALLFTEQLKVLDDVRVIDGMMYLTREGSAPVEEIAGMLHEWAGNYPDDRNYDILQQNLTDPGRTPEERAVSAYALSAMIYTQRAIDILENAYNSESDPLVLDYIEYALELIESSINMS